MKKLLATLVALALLLALPCALAEQVPAINWSDAESAAAEIPGSWYTFEDVALQFWIPDVFQNLEPSEDDPAEMIGKFEVSDGSAGIYAQYLNGYDGLTIDDAVSQLETNGATEIERCTLNGLDAVSFSIPDVDAGYVVFVTQSGNYVQFIFMPASDEGFASVVQLVTASIMPEEA